jgi:hypothetical protein
MLDAEESQAPFNKKLNIYYDEKIWKIYIYIFIGCSWCFYSRLGVQYFF